MNWHSDFSFDILRNIAESNRRIGQAVWDILTVQLYSTTQSPGLTNTPHLTAAKNPTAVSSSTSESTPVLADPTGRSRRSLFTTGHARPAETEPSTVFKERKTQQRSDANSEIPLKYASISPGHNASTETVHLTPYFDITSNNGTPTLPSVNFHHSGSDAEASKPPLDQGPDAEEPKSPLRERPDKEESQLPSLSDLKLPELLSSSGDEDIDPKPPRRLPPSASQSTFLTNKRQHSDATPAVPEVPGQPTPSAEAPKDPEPLKVPLSPQESNSQPPFIVHDTPQCDITPACRKKLQ